MDIQAMAWTNIYFFCFMMFVMRTALHCTSLHCHALNRTALYCTALHCTAMQFTALCDIPSWMTCQIVSDDSAAWTMSDPWLPLVSSVSDNSVRQCELCQAWDTVSNSLVESSFCPLVASSNCPWGSK